MNARHPRPSHYDPSPALRAAARRYPLKAYHESLIRAYAAKHGVAVGYLGHDDFSGIWTIYLRSSDDRTRQFREARVLDVIRRIKEHAA